MAPQRRDKSGLKGLHNSLAKERASGACTPTRAVGCGLEGSVRELRRVNTGVREAWHKGHSLEQDGLTKRGKMASPKEDGSDAPGCYRASGLTRKKRGKCGS